MSTGACGSSLLVDLPDDILVIIGKSLSPRDICYLGLCCRSLNSLAASDKIWLTQCELVGIISPKDLVEWRKAVLSYKAICRFLISVKPLFGIWVHQNPELGNVVYVMPGFVSVVGCRIIPQELGPLGIEGPILWAPVFEVICDDSGGTVFMLHGRDKDRDYIYPGSVKSVEKTCNVLLLEVEPIKGKKRGNLVRSESFDNHSDGESSRKACRSDGRISKSQRFAEPSVLTVPFSKLSFGDRRKLLEIVTSQVRMRAPGSASAPLFPCLRSDGDSFPIDIVHLIERRAMLIKMHGHGEDNIDGIDNHGPPSLPNQIDLSEIKKTLDRSSGFRNSLSGDDTRTQSAKKKTLGDYVRDYTRQMLRKSSSLNSNRGVRKNSTTSSENKHAQLHDFLSSGDTIGLTLHASTMKLSSYRAWPNMHDSRFALYKLPIRVPTVGQEYAGLWGGTFGWPPGKPTDDKPGKALFFLVLSYYEESPGQKLLIATKILEGTHYVLHPNGSAMFIVNVNEPSDEPFPWDSGADALPLTVKQSFSGDGIANGYGFRYPGSKPGSLFVLQDGMLAFLWKESRAILTLQRLDLEELLKKGERVPVLPPITNFSYLTKSYSNVFAGFANMTTSVTSPRRNPS
ncbi:F-box protein At5g39450-like [Chenopodium quinoa]|uniref:F-box protein At5g39450-like n=1 Tax=Chenopodium quinoa TaxID=63459 RepID=UPI000B780B24|nr:F-box protein At5g39450-like [Chenopodium quinoa]